MHRALIVIIGFALAACSPAPAPKAEDVTEATAIAEKKPAPVTDAWIGDWTGVEGTMLKISAGDAPGVYAIYEITLDGPISFAGVNDGAIIRFERNGVQEMIRAGSGDDTGLKYLAGKTNCLVIKSGEGFCRD